MKTRDGFKMCYNLQTGVSDKHKMITYARATQDQNDLNRLAENIREQSQEIDLEPKTSVADTGYFSITEINKVEDKGLFCYIPIPKTKKPVFNYNEKDDIYLCPENKKCINVNRKRKSGNREYNIYLCKDCKNCLSKKKCNLKESTNTKEIWIDTNKEEIDNFKERMKSKEAKEIIKLRKGIVEHPYGTIKMLFGKLGFIVTGLASVQTEIDLVTTAYNIKRLLKVEKNKDVLFKQLEVYFNIEKIMI